MKEVLFCTVTCSNEDGQSYKNEFECANVHEFGRAMITFKPKRGYKVIGTTMWLQMRLV